MALARPPSPAMRLALALARRAVGRTSPNPPVGAVVVREGRVVGKGATAPPGGPHAEVTALAQAGPLAQGADLFVTMEPCAHYGRTPPCVDAILSAGIARVHMALLDPNPRVAGRGLARLRSAGVACEVGEGAVEASRVMAGYLRWITSGLPFVIAKWAMSLDGKTATCTGDSRWISGEASLRAVHRLRAQVDAVMVGVGTVLADDPLLTARDESGRPYPRQPLRVVVDSQGRTPPTARLFSQPGPLLLALADPPPDRLEALRRTGAEVLLLPTEEGRVDLPALMRHLAERGVLTVLVEGGGTLLASLVEAGLVDRVVADIAPLLIGGREAPSPLEGEGVRRVQEALRLREVEVRRRGEDLEVSGYLRLPPLPLEM